MNKVDVIKDNKIIIRIKDGKITANTETPVTFEDLLSATCTLMLGTMNGMVRDAHPDAKADVTDALYDAYNLMVSKTLENFAPQFELRPNLTAKAILEAENNIIKQGRLHEVEPHS